MAIAGAAGCQITGQLPSSTGESNAEQASPVETDEDCGPGEDCGTGEDCGAG